VKIDRRDFLKTAGVATVLATLPVSQLALESRVRGTSRLELETDSRVARVARTACFICGQKCPIRVVVRELDGVEVVGPITFNSGEPEEEYASCGRPQALFEARFLPERIKKPLRRVGEKGSGEFEEISWDEALELLASKLREYSPEEIIVFSHQGCEAGLLSKFFKEVVGIPNVTKHCDTCHTALDYAGWWLFGKLIGPGGYRPDYSNAKLVVFMGRNPLEGIVSAPWTKLFSEGRRRGLRVVVFDVRESRLTALADKYFIVPPGTDLAVSLAILNTILGEKLYNEDYLRKYTNAPMLVYADTLEPVELVDHPEWEGKKTYLVLDEADGELKLKTEAEKPALEAVVEVGGRKAKTVLSLLKEAVREYTPEWASSITGIDPRDIEWVARELAREAPRAFIDPGYKGTRYRNEGMMFRVNLLINTLIGSIGARGGVAWPRKPKIKNPLSIVGVKGRGPVGEPLYKYWEKQGVTFIHKKCYSMLATRSILEEKPRRYKMAILINQNLVSHLQGSLDAIEALKKLDFVVVLDSSLSETALYADLVLPVTMFFEQDSPTLFSPSKTGTGQVTVVEKVVDPPPGVDAKPGWWILKELGKKLDPENASRYEKLGDIEYIVRKQAEALGVDYRELREKGVVTLYREPNYHPLKGKYHNTATGEIELVNVEALQTYREHIGRVSHYNPLPIWMPPLWLQRKSRLGDNEFIAVDICHRMTATNMWIRFTTISRDSLRWDRMDGVWINRSRAEKLGIRDGDLVKLSGPGGELVALARTTDRVHPYVVLAPHATNPGPAGRIFKIKYRDGRVEEVKLFHRGGGKGINTNMLMKLRDMVLEEGGRALQCDVVVKIEKIGGGRQ